MKHSKLQNSETPFFALPKKTLSNAHTLGQNSQKFVKLHDLLQHSKMTTRFFLKQKERSESEKQQAVDLSQDISLYASLVKKPINLLFSLDQFLFEFSKKTYQQKKTGEFFQQLKERKKLSLFYGHLSQKSLAKLFHEARESKGFFSKNVLCLLERRLDVVLYRSGFTQTIAESRQCIAHKKVTLNGKLVTFPSFQLEPGDILSLVPTRKTKLHDHLLHSLQTGQSQTSQKMSAPQGALGGTSKKTLRERSWIVEDFFSKLKKNLKPLPQVSSTGPIVESKLVYLIINFLCTQIKNRASYTLKHTTLSHISFFLRTRRKRAAQLSLRVPQGPQHFFLTFLKWKILGKKAPNTLTFTKTRSFSSWNQNELQKGRKQKERVLYPHLGSIRQHPVFWNRELTNSHYTPFVFGKNQGHPFKFQQKNPQNFFLNSKTSTQKNRKRKDILDCYRHCFLVFLKHLETKRQFHSLVDLHFTKFMSPQFSFSLETRRKRAPQSSFFLGTQKKRGAPFFSKQKPFISKTLAFRVMKPLHLEMSYKLFHVIYLFSPQRVNFPFYIDLDLIRRSLR